MDNFAYISTGNVARVAVPCHAPSTDDPHDHPDDPGDELRFLKQRFSSDSSNYIPWQQQKQWHKQQNY